MPKLILPILLLALGTGAGIGAGLALAPETKAEQATPGDDHAPKTAKTQNHGKDTHGTSSGSDFVKLNNQFVIPVVQHDRVSALVVMSLSLETAGGLAETIYAREPKLRDAFLRVMFDHANRGGFDGAFTRPETLAPLRTALREVAQEELGSDVLGVLIVDIARQDS